MREVAATAILHGMRTLSVKNGSAAVVAAFCLSTAGCSNLLYSPPPLLKDASEAGGNSEGCPEFADLGSLALSPEFDARLKRGFPPGSDATALERELEAEGFKRKANCAMTRSVRRWGYSHDLPIMGTLYGVAYVRVDRQNRIVWTRGFVFNEGFP